MRIVKQGYRTIKLIVQVAWALVLLLAAGVYGAGRLGIIAPIKPYVVMSGSMEPSVPLGSVVISQGKPFGYAVGDVITYTKGGDKATTTHRVVGLKDDNGQIAYETKGDANKNADMTTIYKNEVVGAVLVAIPYIGYAVDFAKKPYGFILLVIVPATIIVYEEMRTIGGELRKGWKKVKNIKNNTATLDPSASLGMTNVVDASIGVSIRQGFDDELGRIAQGKLSLGMTMTENNPSQPLDFALGKPPLTLRGGETAMTRVKPLDKGLTLEGKAPMPPEKHPLMKWFAASMIVPSLRVKEGELVGSNNPSQPPLILRGGGLGDVIGDEIFEDDLDNSDNASLDPSTSLGMTKRDRIPLESHDNNCSPRWNWRQLGIVPAVGAVMIFLGVSGSYFLDRELSPGNVLGAAAVYPTTPTPTISITPTPTAKPIAQHLVINEVMPVSSCKVGQKSGVWIEIYNGYPTEVNLKNFKITDGTNVIDLVTANSVIVPPGEVALLAHDTSIFGKDKCWPDYGSIQANLGGTLIIDNQYKKLKLLDAGGEAIDTVIWGSTPKTDPAVDQSIERYPMNGTDTAVGGNDFEPTDFHIPTDPSPGI